MDRRKAMAVAAALTMSVTSGVIALGANFGAFGVGGATSAAATQNSVPTVGTGQPAAVQTALQQREHDDSARIIQLGADRAATTKGESNE